MFLRKVINYTLGGAFASLAPMAALAQSPELLSPYPLTHTHRPAQEPAGSRTLTLSSALRRTLSANPRLEVAGRDIKIAIGRRNQAGALLNPEASFEVDNALGSGPYRGFRSAETTLQLSQVIELGGKREARIAAGSAEVDSASWQRAALRLEVLSEAAVAFFTMLSAQRRVKLFEEQIAFLDRLTPLLQRRVEAGASSPAETARAQVASDLSHADRERALSALSIARRELSTLMGLSTPDFSQVVGDLNGVGRPPPFETIIQSLDRNPALIRWTSVRAQRHYELLLARLKPIPDLRLSAGWRHFQDTNDNALRLGVAVTLPVWDQNLGNIQAAQETLAKTDAERTASKTALILVLGRAHDTALGSLQEINILQSSAIPNARKAIDVLERGYAEGRFTLLELLDARNAATQAMFRQQEALVNFHTSVATLEALTGLPVSLSRGRAR